MGKNGEQPPEEPDDWETPDEGGEEDEEPVERTKRKRTYRYQCRSCWAKTKAEYEAEEEPAPHLPCGCGGRMELKAETNAMFLFRLHNQVQKTRVQCDVRLSHLALNKRKDEYTENLSKRILAIETDVCKTIEEFGVASKVWETWGSKVRGLGKYSLGKLIAATDIEWAMNPSQLRRFCGFAPGDKRARGKLQHFSMPLKTHCWKIGVSLMRARGRYYMYYLEKKRELADRFEKENRKIVKSAQLPKNEQGKRFEPPDRISEGHVHAMALRKMIQLFLCHYWVVARTVAGLPVTKPYVHDILGHDNYLEPFVDEGLEVVKP